MNTKKILKISIIIIGISALIFFMLLASNTTVKINNYINLRSLDTSCAQDSDCNIVSPGCPGMCADCDSFICAQGTWRDKICPLPSMYEVACAECPVPRFECACIENQCEKVDVDIKTCNSDEDCRFNCPEGCINRMYNSRTGAICDMDPGECKCINNECTFVPE